MNYITKEQLKREFARHGEHVLPGGLVLRGQEVIGRRREATTEDAASGIVHHGGRGHRMGHFVERLYVSHGVMLRPAAAAASGGSKVLTHLPNGTVAHAHLAIPA